MSHTVPPEQTRTAALIGEDGFFRLQNASVAVFGIGGVGGHLAEALARAGVGRIHLVDRDTVSLSNINRQAVALHSTVGRPKAEIMAERIRDISPSCDITAVVGCYNAENRDLLFGYDLDYIVDAIDLVSCKVDLIVTAREKGIPVISALGTGNKTDAQLLAIADIAKTQGCPLARVVRKELRRREIIHHPVVYSPEEGLEPTSQEAPPPGRRSVPGSLVWVTATAGMLLCQHVITELTNG